MRTNKIAPLRDACLTSLGTCAKGVQFYFPSRTYAAIPYYCTIFPFLAHYVWTRLKVELLLFVLLWFIGNERIYSLIKWWTAFIPKYDKGFFFFFFKSTRSLLQISIWGFWKKWELKLLGNYLCIWIRKYLLCFQYDSGFKLRIWCSPTICTYIKWLTSSWST